MQSYVESVGGGWTANQVSLLLWLLVEGGMGGRSREVVGVATFHAEGNGDKRRLSRDHS